MTSIVHNNDGSFQKKKNKNTNFFFHIKYSSRGLFRVRHLPSKYEDLTLSSQNPHRAGTILHVCNPSSSVEI